MSSKFPTNEYSSKRDKWLGYKAIVLPTIRNTLNGKIEGKSILDIGCGNGHFSRKFLEWQARKVLGIDNNEEMILKCWEDCTNPEKLSYVHVGIDEFITRELFDVTTAFFVFQFLSSVELLEKSFKNVFSSLKEGGILVALVPNGTKEYNPQSEEGKKFGAATVLPQEELRDGLPLSINFYDGEEVIGKSTIYFYFRETYERLLKEAGFSRVEWRDPSVDEKAQQLYGKEFFQSYMNPPKDIVLLSFKEK